MSYRAGNHHARGQGLQSLVEVNQDEMERKRLKTLEHQVLSLIWKISYLFTRNEWILFLCCTTYKYYMHLLT